jgi:hypothetical protein
MTGGDGSVGELLDALHRWVPKLLPDAERARRLAAALGEAAPDRDARVDAATCAALAAAGRRVSRHLELEYVPDGSLVPDATSPGWDPPNPVEVRQRAASVSQVHRSADGIATITLTALDDLALAAPYVDAAFALARGCRGVVLDLRENGGGDPATAALVIGWLLGGARVQLSTVCYTEQRLPVWTPGLRADRELAGTPVAVLTSSRTFSSAEGLAYHLKARQRAATVGEATGGAADHITPIRLTRHVRGMLPHGYVVDARTGTNWEGVGVPPDLPCPAADAPARAHAWLLGR